jgi:hypothetical protein
MRADGDVSEVDAIDGRDVKALEGGLLTRLLALEV